MNTLKKCLAFSLIFVSLLSFAQEKKHLAESKDIIGLWRHVIPAKGADGDTRMIYTGNYKVINPDGTFYTFIGGKGGKGIEGMFLYGEYKITSDSTLTEHVIKHARPSFSNSDSTMRYKIVDNDFLMLSFKNENITKGRESKEIWERIKMVNDRKEYSPENLF